MKKNTKLLGITFLIFITTLATFLSYKKSNFASITLKTGIKRIAKKILKQKGDPIVIKNLAGLLASYETKFKSSLKDIEVGKMKDLELDNGMLLKRYKLTEGFYQGIHEEFPGSGYLDHYKENLIVLSARGVLGYSSNLENDLKFKQIKNNIEEFIGIKQFEKDRWFSIKDLEIINDKIYISYNKEYEDDCWNTSIIYADMNFQNIKFKKFYSPDTCINALNNPDNEFNSHQSGGRIINFKNDSILFSIGDYRSRYLAQETDSVNGKIIRINIRNKKSRVISMGHRNPQGLFFDQKRDFIIETEHGPQGGDEINLIKINDIKNKNIPNYGWAISSAGEHYGGKIEKNVLKYQKYPLHKSHINYGFKEPLKSFLPSIGISEITKINNNSYVVASLKAKSLYFFEIIDEKINNMVKVNVSERVRDILYENKNLFLFLEDTASIGKISL